MRELEFPKSAEDFLCRVNFASQERVPIHFSISWPEIRLTKVLDSDILEVVRAPVPTESAPEHTEAEALGALGIVPGILKRIRRSHVSESNYQKTLPCID